MQTNSKETNLNRLVQGGQLYQAFSFSKGSLGKKLTNDPKFGGSNPDTTGTSGLYYKSFTVVIYNCNGSTIVEPLL